MVKVTLSTIKQVELINALGELDTYEVISTDAEGKPRLSRVPYKLGPARRSLVKNIALLKDTLKTHEEARKALFKEIWPDLPENASVTQQDDPVNFEMFQHDHAELLQHEEQLELGTFPAAAMYPNGDAREFPATALLVLEEHGLIE